MTITSRHRIRNSSPARHLSVTEAPHYIESLRGSGEETFCFLEYCSNPRSPTFQTGSFDHCTRAPALCRDKFSMGTIFQKKVLSLSVAVRGEEGGWSDHGIPILLSPANPVSPRDPGKPEQGRSLSTRLPIRFVTTTWPGFDLEKRSRHSKDDVQSAMADLDCNAQKKNNNCLL